jgi:hypothetical protein
MLLSYQYLQMLPSLAQGSANKVFVIPSDFSQALGHISGALAPPPPRDGEPPRKPRSRSDSDAAEEAARAAAADTEEAARAAREAEAAAQSATRPVGGNVASVMPEPGPEQPGPEQPGADAPGPGTAYRE